MMPGRLTRLAPLLLLLLAAQAWAGPIEESKAHYDRAIELSRHEHYKQALGEFQAAYDLQPKPVLLYNMAQCYRRLGQAREALDHYQRYYDLEPDKTEDMKAKVQAYLAQMRSWLERKSGAPGEDPGLAPAPAPAPQPPLPPPPAVAAKPPPRPIYKRWWFWSALGVVTAGAVAGIVAATYPRDSGPAPGLPEVIGPGAWMGRK